MGIVRGGGLHTSLRKYHKVWGAFSIMVIIGAVDKSARASAVVREAGKLASAFEEPAHIVHVMTQSQFVDLQQTSAKRVGDIVDMDEVREMAAEVAEDAVEEFDVPYETVGLVGDPASQLVRYADEQDAQYIVIAGRKRSPTGKVIAGSVAQSVILNAGCPVVSVIQQK